MSTQGRSPASLDMTHDPALLNGDSMGLPKLPSMGGGKRPPPHGVAKP